MRFELIFPEITTQYPSPVRRWPPWIPILNYYLLVGKERLELSRLSAPAPKAGASTNSATFAADFAKRASIAETPLFRYVTGLYQAWNKWTLPCR